MNGNRSSRWLRCGGPVPRAIMLSLATLGCAGVGELPAYTGGNANDEQLIAGILTDVHDGLETQRIYKVLAHLSRDYRDAEGRDYDAMKAYLDETFKRYWRIRITRERPRVIIEGDSARAIETFATIAEADPSAGAEQVNLEGQVTVHFKRIDGRWLITEWGRLI